MRAIGFVLVMVLVSGCIDPFVYTPGSVDKYYVIFGNITDQPGPYTVKITTSIPLDRSARSEDVKGAKVTITDDAGASDHLVDMGAGIYRTTSIQGQVGRSYVLHVTTPDGEQFASSPEKIIPVGNLSNFRAEFVENVDSTNLPQRNIANGFNLFLNSELDPEQEGHVFWKWSATFEYTTNPENKGYWLGTKIWVPTPEVCSGFYVDRTGRLIQFGACTCCTCWHTFYNDRPLLSDVNTVRNNTIIDAPVGFISVSGRFTNKVVVILNQESVSPTVYKFWQSVKDASNLGSELFQSPPAKTIGNIRSVDENAKYVLGVFSAAAVRSDTLQILRDQIPYTPDARYPSATSCLGTFQLDNTNIRPTWY